MPRRLGQHFLRPAAAARLLHAIDPRPDETFLEIGPGTGALTLGLAAKAARVVAVEIDGALCELLHRRAPANVEIVHADALAVDLGALAPAGVRVAGNLPYYASSPLLRRLLELRGRARDLHAMVQEEVAERVASGPGSKRYGILSVLFGLWAEVDVPLRFPPGAFSPQPKVSSALLRIRFLSGPRAEIGDATGFERFLQTAFSRRRRTLENNLRDSYPNLKENLRLLKIAGSRRAETLSVVEFAALFRGLMLDSKAEGSGSATP